MCGERLCVSDEGLESSRLQMTEGDGYAVGGVVGMGGFIQIQELANHGLHLKFIGVAVTCERLFDGCGRIFGQRQIGESSRKQGCAARLANGDSGCYIASEEKLFDSNFMRLELSDQFLYVEEDLAQTKVHRLFGACTDHSAGEQFIVSGAVLDDDAVSG